MGLNYRIRTGVYYIHLKKNWVINHKTWREKKNKHLLQQYFFLLNFKYKIKHLYKNDQCLNQLNFKLNLMRMN